MKGQITNTSIYGHIYFLKVVDRSTWIYLMKSKGEARSLLSNFIVYVKNQFNLYIKTIITVNGKEVNYDELYNIYGCVSKIMCWNFSTELCYST